MEIPIWDILGFEKVKQFTKGGQPSKIKLCGRVIFLLPAVETPLFKETFA